MEYSTEPGNARATPGILAAVPSLIGHSLVGLGVAQGLFGFRSKQVLAGAIICAGLADLDVIGVAWKIPYESFFGHRGFFHSIFFALVLATTMMPIGFRGLSPRRGRWWAIWGLFAFLACSHGVLDTMTHGYGGPAGHGVALLSPLDSTRYWMSWQPIVIAPGGLREFFDGGKMTDWGKAVLVSEALYLYLPTVALVVVGALVRRWRQRRLGCL
ncbi:MAG: metal-dependent hydrolase [Planctomycetaceae bacterium]|nr:metal-dependent hydrolase [Planctomycetaceae bacterium]